MRARNAPTRLEYHCFKMLCIVVALCLVAGCAQGDRPLLKIAQGSLEGFYTKTRSGRNVAAYTAIPYAEPPLGQLRFKAPVPAGDWEGVLDASREASICVQRNPYIRQEGIHGTEDCLYLNVYVPEDRKDETQPLPVMVWFHGGGFMCGAGVKSFYGPDFLLDRDVILVATNYRLGPLGFLSTMDEQCPGNNGLKDQQEALRWIQKNIHYFGGDNSSVTLFGESAGGSSVHLHMLSPTSAGLFQKAISQSGTAVVPWANSPPGEALRQARTLARLMSCPFTPSDKFIDCLRSKSAEDIIDTEFSIYFWDYDQMTPFKPVVEPRLPGAFLDRFPREVPDVPSVPWMTGLTTDEGCMKSTWLLSNKTLMREFSTGFDSIAPVTFYYEYSPDVEGTTRNIQDIYFNGKRAGEIDETDKQGLIDIYTDSYFAYGLVEALRTHFKYTKHPTFLYQISYRANNSLSQIFGDPHGNHGVCHADDLIYLFPLDFLGNKWSETDKEMSELMLDIWTNFATYGNPNTRTAAAKSDRVVSGWQPATDDATRQFLDIGDSLVMQRGLAERSTLWDQLPLWHKFHTHTARAQSDEHAGIKEEL